MQKSKNNKEQEELEKFVRPLIDKFNKDNNSDFRFEKTIYIDRRCLYKVLLNYNKKIYEIYVLGTDVDDKNYNNIKMNFISQLSGEFRKNLYESNRK